MKGEFVQPSKSLKIYYQHDCKIYVAFYVFILTTLIVKNSYFGWNLLYRSKKNAVIKFGPPWKDWKSSYLSNKRQILAWFCKLFALILRWNYVKGLRFTKIVTNFRFERVWGCVSSKKSFQRQMFSCEIAQWEKFNFHFSGDFCSYWRETKR